MTISPFDFFKVFHICNRNKIATRAALYKKSETMKNFFIVAVALLALCSSCETADESFLTETDKTTTTAQKTNNVFNADYETYTTIVNSFVYTKGKTYAENLKKFEQHVNRLLPYDEVEADVYETIDNEQLTKLIHAETSFVKQLQYSPAFKEDLYILLYKDGQINRTLENDNETHLLNTLFAMCNDNNGNDKDDKIKDRRTIAFAYGAQYSLKQAVLYAGAIELLAFQ